jgi:hypothetical protein
VPGDATFFKRREFCFTLDGDIFARYKSYQVLLQDGNTVNTCLHNTEVHCSWFLPCNAFCPFTSRAASVRTSDQKYIGVQAKLLLHLGDLMRREIIAERRRAGDSP